MSRTLRKVAFIDDVSAPDPNLKSYPKANEHWLVEILRENLSNTGKGCFVLKPLRKLEEVDLSPLIHGMYALEMVQDTLLLTPYDLTKFWVLSKLAKDELLKSYGNASAIVINHGGRPWKRRKPPRDHFAESTSAIIKQEANDE